jgi:hypothetical protein
VLLEDLEWVKVEGDPRRTNLYRAQLPPGIEVSSAMDAVTIIHTLTPPATRTMIQTLIPPPSFTPSFTGELRRADTRDA